MENIFTIRLSEDNLYPNKLSESNNLKIKFRIIFWLKIKFSTKQLPIEATAMYHKMTNKIFIIPIERKCGGK